MFQKAIIFISILYFLTISCQSQDKAYSQIFIPDKEVELLAQKYDIQCDKL
jgi:hypothetical protein